MSEPVHDKRKYFLMKSKYGPCRCGKNVTRRYFQFPLGYKNQVLQPGVFVFFFSSLSLSFNPTSSSALFPSDLGWEAQVSLASAIAGWGPKPTSQLYNLAARACAKAKEVCNSATNSPADLEFLIMQELQWQQNSMHTGFSPKPSFVLLTWMYAKIRQCGDFRLLCLISFSYVPHCGWHFPPLFPFSFPVQNGVIYEGDKAEHIL